MPEHPLYVVVAGDQLLVRRGLNIHRLLNQSIKQLPSVPGCPPVESEREFVQIVVEVSSTDGPVMCPQQPSLQKRRDPVNARQQITGRFLVAS